MTGDLSEGGKTVSWNVYNKITNVSMSSGTKTLAFGYDAAGNRVRKESMSGGTTTKQWYVRDAQGNIMSTYKQVGTGTLKQEYVYLYGSTRTGEYLLNRDSATLWNRHYYRAKGNRHYELTNHLGNVLAVVTDRKMAKDTTADATYTPQFFMPDVYSVQNYYAFGQSMPKWSTTAAVNDPKKYRFGYNGKEDDDEWGKQDYGGRICDVRLGRWLSVDPLYIQQPQFSPYNAFGNAPIFYIDPDGKDNIVYYVITGKTQLKTADIKRLEEVGNFIFTHNNINAQVKILKYDGNKGPIDPSLLDPTDQIVYIGEASTIEKLYPGTMGEDGEKKLFGYSYTSEPTGKVAMVNLTAYNEETNFIMNPTDKKYQKIYNSPSDKMAEAARTAAHEMGHNVLKENSHTEDDRHNTERWAGMGGSLLLDANIMSGGRRPKSRFAIQQDPKGFDFLSPDIKTMQEYFPATRTKVVINPNTFELEISSEKVTPKDNLSKKIKQKYEINN